MKLDAYAKALGSALALTLGVGTSHAAEYRWLSSFDRSQAQSVPFFAEPFMKAVETASNGSIKFVVSGPETIPLFEQLQPAASGAFQFLYTHGAYHFGTTPILTAFEAVGGDEKARRESGVLEWIDKYYQKLGVKLVASPMTSEGGYGILLRQPPTPAGDLQGRKIRGTPSYNAVFRMLGATPVQMPPGEIYQALEKGVVDGAAWPTVGPLNYRWYEVAKYLLKPAFGFNMNPIFMNLAAWNKLTDAERKILTDVGKKYEAVWYKEYARLVQEEDKALVSKGMQIVEMGAAQKAKLREAWSEGLWDMSIQKSKKDVEELRALAKSKGL